MGWGHIANCVWNEKKQGNKCRAHGHLVFGDWPAG